MSLNSLNNLMEGKTMLLKTEAQAQFVEDYLLVMENDFDSYSEIQELIKEKGGDVGAIATKAQERFENYICQVAEREEELGHEAGALLIKQCLLNWGADTWYQIAKQLTDKE